MGTWTFSLSLDEGKLFSWINTRNYDSSQRRNLDLSRYTKIIRRIMYFMSGRYFSCYTLNNHNGVENSFTPLPWTIHPIKKDRYALNYYKNTSTNNHIYYLKYHPNQTLYSTIFCHTQLFNNQWPHSFFVMTHRKCTTP